MSNNNGNVQDWTPVVLKRKLTKEEATRKGVGQIVEKKQFTQSASVVKKLETDENYKPPTISSYMGQQIIQARIAKKWNQDELARQAQIPVAVIKEWERPTSTTYLNQNYLNKISKALGVNIKREA